MHTYTPTPPISKETIENLKSYYHKGNFPELVAHSGGWDIYAQSQPDENGFVQCAAIPTTPGGLPHPYGTIDDVAKMIKQGHIRTVIGNLHLAPSDVVKKDGCDKGLRPNVVNDCFGLSWDEIERMQGGKLTRMKS